MTHSSDTLTLAILVGAPILFSHEKMKFVEALVAFVSIAGSSTAFQSPVTPSIAVSSSVRNTAVSGSALLAATLDGTAVNVPTGVRRKKTKQVSEASGAACPCDEKNDA